MLHAASVYNDQRQHAKDGRTRREKQAGSLILCSYCPSPKCPASRFLVIETNKQKQINKTHLFD